MTNEMDRECDKYGEREDFYTSFWCVNLNTRDHLEELDVDGRKALQDMQCADERNIEGRSRNHCCRGKAIIITYSECVFVVLVIQLAMRMRRIVSTSVACLSVPYFSTFSQKMAQFSGKKNVIEHYISFDFI